MPLRPSSSAGLIFSVAGASSAGFALSAGFASSVAGASAGFTSLRLMSPRVTDCSKEVPM